MTKAQLAAANEKYEKCVDTTYAWHMGHEALREECQGYADRLGEILNNSGTPAYIELVSADSSQTKFYLWIGTDGKLRIASEQALGGDASPPTVAWDDGSGPLVGAS